MARYWTRSLRNGKTPHFVECEYSISREETNSDIIVYDEREDHDITYQCHQEREFMYEDYDEFVDVIEVTANNVESINAGLPLYDASAKTRKF